MIPPPRRAIRFLVLTWLSYAIVGYGLTSASLSFASSVIPAKFEETLLKVVPVAGSVLMGVQYADSTMSTPDSLWVYLPFASEDRFCVSVVSDDGLYNASAEYPLQGRAQGELTLSFPTNQKAELTRYGTRRLSLLGAVRKTCNGVDPPGFTKTYLPLGWSQPSNSKVSILVNAPDIDVQVFDSATRQYTDCKGPISKTPVAFGTECILAIGNGTNEWQGYIVRSSFQDTLPQIPLHIGHRQ